MLDGWTCQNVAETLPAADAGGRDVMGQGHQKAPIHVAASKAGYVPAKVTSLVAQKHITPARKRMPAPLFSCQAHLFHNSAANKLAGDLMVRLSALSSHRGSTYIVGWS